MTILHSPEPKARRTGLWRVTMALTPERANYIKETSRDAVWDAVVYISNGEPQHYIDMEDAAAMGGVRVVEWVEFLFSLQGSQQ